jgi:hypothetical protein
VALSAAQISRARDVNGRLAAQLGWGARAPYSGPTDANLARDIAVGQEGARGAAGPVDGMAGEKTRAYARAQGSDNILNRAINWNPLPPPAPPPQQVVAPAPPPPPAAGGGAATPAGARASLWSRIPKPVKIAGALLLPGGFILAAVMAGGKKKKPAAGAAR